MGFPEFYGRNMDAWIDCMSDPDFNDGLRKALFNPGNALTLLLREAGSFRDRCPDLWSDLVDGTAIANMRRLEANQRPLIVLAYRG